MVLKPADDLYKFLGLSILALTSVCNPISAKHTPWHPHTNYIVGV
jgi:hypothetical protein